MSCHIIRLRRGLSGFYRRFNRTAIQGRGPFAFDVSLHQAAGRGFGLCASVGFPHLYASRVKPTLAVWELRRVWLSLPGDVGLFVHDEEG